MKQGKKASAKWTREFDEDDFSFVADTESDGAEDISIKKCFKCDIEFEEEDDEIYGCDNCPRWFHCHCLPQMVLQMAESEGLEIKDMDFDCNYCTH